MKKMTIQIKTHPFKKHWWFVVCASNGKITSTSETYKREYSARKTAQTYIDNGLNAVIVNET